MRDLADLFRDDLNHEKKSALLNQFAGCDDMWWMRILRESQREDQENPWLRLVCWRTPGPESFWKPRTDFPVDIVSWNEKLQNMPDPRVLRQCTSTVAGLENEGVLIARHKFKAWAQDLNGRDRLQVYSSPAASEGVSDVSALVRALRTAWNEDVQMHAFRVPGCAITTQALLDRLELALEVTADGE